MLNHLHACALSVMNIIILNYIKLIYYYDDIMLGEFMD